MANRIWLIGNGPSLLHTPLNLLKDEHCMALNKIARIFEVTEWRPTHYVKVDFSEFTGDDWRDEVWPVVACGAKMLLWDAFRDGAGERGIVAGGDLPNTTWVQRCKKHHYYAVGDEKAPISWHLPDLCTAINSMSIMAQWAVLLGYDEIYLVGCDLGYTNGDNDHFFAGYYHSVDSSYADRNNRSALGAHKIIKRSCPIPVYNATVGGLLEVYPRVNLEDVINGTQKES
jgi:hypothetical protein